MIGVELAVVLDADPSTARETARRHHVCIRRRDRTAELNSLWRSNPASATPENPPRSFVPTNE